MDNEIYDVVEITDDTKVYTGVIIESREEVRETKSAYPSLYHNDISHGDDGNPATLEKRNVVVNYYGTFFTKDPIEKIESDGYIVFEQYEDEYDDDGNLIDSEVVSDGASLNYTDDALTVSEFIASVVA